MATSNRTPERSEAPTREPTPNAGLAGMAWTFYYLAGSERVAMRVVEGSSNTLYYLFTDHLGSTSEVRNADGSLHSAQGYTAFGEVWYRMGSLPTDRTYTGQTEIEFGLMHYGARAYDPYLNRFLSPDSIVPDPTNPIDFDRYVYARNNPVRYTDSSGHCIDGLTTIACLIIIGSIILKAVDYGWTAYDAYQSGRVIADPNASRGDKMMAGLNVGLAALFEAAEPDDFLPAGLPLDDAARKVVMKGAKEAFEEGGEEGLEKFLRDSLGGHADEVLDNLGLGKSLKDSERILQTGGHTMKKETLEALGLSKDQAHQAWNKFKNHYGLRNDFHGKIRADGAVLDPNTNEIIGYLTDFVP